MIQRNPVFATLTPTYLFHEVACRKKAFLEKNPAVSLISLSIGDTTEPIPECIARGLAQFAERLSSREGYSGYGPEQGMKELRESIGNTFYKDLVEPDDLFISDGAKCDLGRLQKMFGGGVSIAVQDPTYPVYVDGSVLQGVKKIIRLPCTPENNFWPDWEQVERADIIYWCSPNNPTGIASTRQQLKQLVDLALKQNSLIVFDAAYFNYIQSSDVPRSIYEIEGATQVAIEVCSFSKLVGFTGVRLGWTIVPEQLKYASGESIKNDWRRLTGTIFNGASNISQQGGLAVMQPAGLIEMQKMTDFYLENAALLKVALLKKGYQVHGGEHAPYLWVHFPRKNSWEVFQEWLDKAHLITTPGSGFGIHGEGFLRLSAFAPREKISEAAKRIEEL